MIHIKDPKMCVHSSKMPVWVPANQNARSFELTSKCREASQNPQHKRDSEIVLGGPI